MRIKKERNSTWQKKKEDKLMKTNSSNGSLQRLKEIKLITLSKVNSKIVT